MLPASCNFRLPESVIEELEGADLEERVGMAKMFLANKDI